METIHKNEPDFVSGIQDSFVEVDIASCNRCGGCVEIAPEIFRFNEMFGFLEVVERQLYDSDVVEEAIRNCPKKAIRMVSG